MHREMEKDLGPELCLLHLFHMLLQPFDPSVHPRADFCEHDWYLVLRLERSRLPHL